MSYPNILRDEKLRNLLLFYSFFGSDDNELFNNNQQLIEQIVTSEGVTYTEADNAIKNFVASIDTTLTGHQNQSYNIPEVGRLYLDLDENMTFISSGQNFLKEAYGLPKIQFFPVSRQYVKAETPIPIEEPKPKATILTRVVAMWRDRYTRTIVIIILLLIVLVPRAFQYINQKESFVPTIVDAEDIGNQENIIDETFQPFPNSQIEELITDNTNQSSFKPKRVNIPPQKVDLKTAETTNYKPAEVIKKDQPEVKKPRKKRVITPKPKTTPSVSEQPTFIVVIGAYGSIENANIAIKKVSKLGYTPDLGKSKNLHRVGIQLFCTESELPAKLKTIRKTYKSAWVLK